MFFIDYELPWYSRYFLFLDAPFRFCFRHLFFYFQAKSIQKYTGVVILSKAQKRAHMSIALLESIPILGHVVALFDWLLFHKPLRLIHIDTTKTLIDECSAELHFMIDSVLPFYKAVITNQGKDPLAEAKKLEKYIPERFIEEMKALSAVSEIPYESILLLNTVISMLELASSSIYAVSKDRTTGLEAREFATNYFPSLGRSHHAVDVDNSFKRYDDMSSYKPKLSTRDLLRTLRRVHYKATIHTVIADTNARKLSVAVGCDFSANRPLKVFKAASLFGTNEEVLGTHKTMLARNLDWPMAYFAPLTRLFVRKGSAQFHTTAMIHAPGFLGGYTGMNEHGLTLASSIVPSKSQEGIPNQLLYRKILEEAKTIHEAYKIINLSQPSSAMNVIIAGPDGIMHAELDPMRRKVGAISVSFSSFQS
ncbi:MAG: hypothetical protein JSR46_06520 [Verrucomicrobia bacterium]|nr:hypothetical protein [Verrucomicrobiota bacterium]